jgi:hypothetical protein
MNMRKTILGITIGIAMFSVLLFTMSMTISDARKDKRFGGYGPHVILTVPAKPLHTLYVLGTDDMYKYIKKGYQVQEVVGTDNNTDAHRFLMVKY